MIMYFYLVFITRFIKSNPECLPGSMECIGQVLYMCDINNSWTSTLCPDNTRCTVKGNQITCEKKAISDLLGDDESNDDSLHNHSTHSDKNRGDKYFILGEEGSDAENSTKKKKPKKNKSSKKKSKPSENSIEDEESKGIQNDVLKKKDYYRSKRKNKNETDKSSKRKKDKEDGDNNSNIHNSGEKEENTKASKEKRKSKEKEKEEDFSMIQSANDFNELIENIPEKLKQIETSLNKKGSEDKNKEVEKDAKALPSKIGKPEKKTKKTNENEEEDMVKVVQTILIKDSSNFLNNSGDSPIPQKNHVDLKKITIRKIPNSSSAKDKGNSHVPIPKTIASSNGGANTPPSLNNDVSSNDPIDQNTGIPSPQSSTPPPTTPNKQTSTSQPSNISPSPTAAPTNTSALTPPTASTPESIAKSPAAPITTSSPNPKGTDPKSAGSGDSKPTGQSPSSSALTGDKKDATKPTSSSSSTPNTPTKEAGGPSGATDSTKKPPNTSSSSKSQGGGDPGNFTKEKIEEIVQQCGFQANPQYAQAVADGIGKIDEKQRSMFLAQIIHESAGLSAIEEIACKEGGGCANNYKDDAGLPGKDYHGRGFIQLTWGANYKAASEGLGLGDKLLTNPEVVSEDPNMAMDTSVWFWNERVAKDPGVQQNKFGATTNVINGPIECQGAGNDTPPKRYKIYQTVAKGVGETDLASEEGCGGGGSSSAPTANPAPGAQPSGSPSPT